MPVVVKLDDVLHARRMTLTELAAAICTVLDCQPGDILRFEGGEA